MYLKKKNRREAVFPFSPDGFIISYLQFFLLAQYML